MGEGRACTQVKYVLKLPRRVWQASSVWAAWGVLTMARLSLCVCVCAIAHISAACSATHPSVIIKFCQPMGKEIEGSKQRQEAAVKEDGDAH